MASKIQLRRDTAQNWSNNNPILASGEPGFETDTGKVKYGDGNTYWNDLAYAGGGGGGVTNNGSVYIGNNAGSCSSGSECSVGIGCGAGQYNQSCCAVAIGESAGRNCQGNRAIAIGNDAGRNSQGSNAIAIGTCAGEYNQSCDAIAIGNDAGNGCCCRQQQYAVAIGYAAGYCDQQCNSIAIGYTAGRCSQQQYAVAVGSEAGNCDQSQYSVAVGYRAGNCCQGQGPYMSGGAVAIGEEAGYYEQEYHAIAIGKEAGRCCQGFSAVAIGRSAGYYCQGHGAVAVGKNAGNCCQGDNAIAIGNYAGRCDQQCSAVAIGYYAAENNQQSNAVAIGANSARNQVDWYTIQHDSGFGGTNDGSDNTVTVVSNFDFNNIKPGMLLQNNGYSDMLILAINGNTLTLAGTPNNGSIYAGGQFNVKAVQGTNSIAIGSYAASKTQFPNSIVINATGSEVDSAGTGTTVIQSLRQVSGSVPSGFQSVYWNPTTGELITVTP